MEIIALPLAGLLLIKPRVFTDARGTFFESYAAARYRAAGITADFVQDNHSRSRRHVVRGLHYRVPGQARLVRVTLGRTFHVAVDLRPESPTFGRHHARELDADAPAELYLPEGFAHGFCVLTEWADVVYKVSAPYQADAERQIRWNDPELAVPWPVSAPLLSPRDQTAESFAEFKRRAGVP